MIVVNEVVRLLRGDARAHHAGDGLALGDDLLQQLTAEMAAANMRTKVLDMQLALETVKKLRGGVCAVRGSKVLASVALPIAGLLSDQRAPVVAKETTALKRAWEKPGCKVPYMGFNLLPLSVIPDFRLTDKGLVDVKAMKLVALFEE